MRGETSKLYRLKKGAEQESRPLERYLEEYLDMNRQDDEHIHIVKNLRQIYAYKVLESYYQFQIDKLVETYSELYDERTIALQEDWNQLDLEYEQKKDELRDQIERMKTSNNSDFYEAKMYYELNLSSYGNVEVPQAEEEQPEFELIEEDLIPQIEREALPMYPESYDTGTIHLETDNVFGVQFGISFDGESFDLYVDTPLGGKGIVWSPYTYDQYKTYTINSVKFEFNTQWALKPNTVQAALNRSGKVGDLVGKLGKIGIGFTNHTREGTYTVAKWGGPILDQGTLYIREQGGSIGDFGKVERVEVIKSQMKGYTEKKTTVKYTFDFVSHSSKR